MTRNVLMGIPITKERVYTVYRSKLTSSRELTVIKSPPILLSVIYKISCQFVLKRARIDKM